MKKIPFFLLFLFSLWSGELFATERYALLIANSQYDSEFGNLVMPKIDVATLIPVLRQNGFKVFDDYDLDREGMKKAISEFIQQLNPGDVALFYYAGHGLQDDKEYDWLIPVREYITNQGELDAIAVNVRDVLRSMAGKVNQHKQRNGVVLMLLDACRDAPLPPQLISRSLRGQGLAQITDPAQGVFISFAATPGKRIPDAGRYGKGTYVNNLVNVLQQYSGETVGEMFNRVIAGVQQESDGSQQPWIQSTLVGDFCFHPKGCAKTVWKTIEQNPTQDSLRQFLSDYPSSDFAGAARLLLNNLSSSVPPVLSPTVPIRPDVDETPPVADNESPGTVFQDKLKDGGLGPKMVWIPAGRFQMGDLQGTGLDNEKPVHWVDVEKFAMGQYEVTRGEFRQFVESSGYKTEAETCGGCYSYNWEEKVFKLKTEFNWHNGEFSQGETHPVVCISWNDANAYAEWLSKQAGRTYRLPTEAEWEYAARAGTTGHYFWGNNPYDICYNANVVNFWNTYLNCKGSYVYAAPVGLFKPNNFGLYDMAGNVGEWTCSRYTDKYDGNELKCDAVVSEKQRIVRGGSWLIAPNFLRSATRNVGVDLAVRDTSRGFRIIGLVFNTSPVPKLKPTDPVRTYIVPQATPTRKDVAPQMIVSTEEDDDYCHIIINGQYVPLQGVHINGKSGGYRDRSGNIYYPEQIQVVKSDNDCLATLTQPIIFREIKD